MSVLLTILFWLSVMIGVGWGIGMLIGAIIAYRYHVKDTYAAPLYGKATYAQVVEAYRMLYKAGMDICAKYADSGTFRLVIRPTNSAGLNITMNCEPKYNTLMHYSPGNRAVLEKYQEGKDLARQIEGKFTPNGVILIRDRGMLLPFGDFIRYHFWLKKMILIGGTLSPGGVDWATELKEMRGE